MIPSVSNGNKLNCRDMQILLKVMAILCFKSSYFWILGKCIQLFPSLCRTREWSYFVMSSLSSFTSFSQKKKLLEIKNQERCASRMAKETNMQRVMSSSHLKNLTDEYNSSGRLLTFWSKHSSLWFMIDSVFCPSFPRTN